jgi:hypothetical protein
LYRVVSIIKKQSFIIIIINDVTPISATQEIYHLSLCTVSDSKRESRRKIILHVEKFEVSSDGTAARSGAVAPRFSATIIMSVFPFASSENLNGNVVLA